MRELDTVSGSNIIETRRLSGEFDGSNAEARLGATSVEIRIYADYLDGNHELVIPFDYSADDAVAIQLKDGTVIHPKLMSSMCDQTMAAFGYEMSFVNPADTASVTFCGVLIGS